MGEQMTAALTFEIPYGHGVKDFEFVVLLISIVKSNDSSSARPFMMLLNGFLCILNF